MASSSSLSTVSPSPWELWLDEALVSLTEAKLLRSLRPIFPSQPSPHSPPPASSSSSSSSSLSSSSFYYDTNDKELQTFHGPGAWDRSGVEIEISRPTLKLWIDDIPGLGNV